ncbi:MAG TPA: hypothetical protein VK639_18865 [Terriglobales bacterium]|nr:hypothetical protein [Terriglobales bacterium]
MATAEELPASGAASVFYDQNSLTNLLRTPVDELPGEAYLWLLLTACHHHDRILFFRVCTLTKPP